jgi:hypothetical protein
LGGPARAGPSKPTRPGFSLGGEHVVLQPDFVM